MTGQAVPSLGPPVPERSRALPTSLRYIPRRTSLTRQS